MKDKKNVCVVASNYTLWLYLLLINSPLKESFFIFGQGININFEMLDYFFPIEKQYKHKWLKLLGRFIDNRKAKIFFKKNKLQDKKIYGVDHSIYGRYLKKYHKIYLLEDGTANYLVKEIKDKKSWSKKLREKILWISPDFGLVKNVEKIYLTGIGKIPEILKEKTEIINLEILWKNYNYQEEIKKLFFIDEKVERQFKDKKEILLTQPLSEDGIISEKEKIELYKKILKNYKKEDILIKRHPREVTDYKSFFPECEIIENTAPLQFLLLLVPSVKKLITIFSTGVLIKDKNIDIDFYGTEINSKLFSKFGSLDKIFKKNAYIVEED